ncbi:MAG: calcium/sodium antiporter [Candidatus Ratteibacteria bacterium]|jgi:cation:H+ antiporter
MHDMIILIIGLVCAGVGGELFVRGLVGIAFIAGISAGIVGATVSAFATSSPELFVGVSAALSHAPHISFGNILGANVVNIVMVLGLTLTLTGSIRGSITDIKRDLSIAFLAPVITGILLLDGTLSRIDGVIMLAIFFLWIATVLRDLRKERLTSKSSLQKSNPRITLIYSAIGLALLFGAGKFIISGARGIAISLGWSEFIIGQIIVAIGTTIPELATTLISRIRGHDEVGLGTVMGSNIFNGLFIVGIVAILSPISISLTAAGKALLAGIIAIALIIPSKKGRLGRVRGGVLLLFYILYIVITFQ